MDYSALPGYELIADGLRDLEQGRQTAPALLVAIGAERLRRIGLNVPNVTVADPEHELYVHCSRVRNPMRRTHATTRCSGNLSVSSGPWNAPPLLECPARRIDVDLQTEVDELLRALPRLEEDLEINVELASPGHFIPELPGWKDRSLFITRQGRLSFHHYDFYAQALSKIERGHSRDLGDVREMHSRGLIEPEALARFFDAIESQLIVTRRSIRSFRAAVERTIVDLQRRRT